MGAREVMATHIQEVIVYDVDSFSRAPFTGTISDVEERMEADSDR